MESNSNSQHSNFFVISSESSRQAHPKGKKQRYVRFAKKVQELLDVEGNDLQQLYRKLQAIVKKYFYEHRIVEFDQMYEYIRTLKSNSKKMNDIVNILEKRLNSKESNNSNQRMELKGEQFQLTNTTNKQTKNSTNSSSKEPLHHHNSTEDNEDSVNTSIKYNHIFKPAIKPILQNKIQHTQPRNNDQSPLKSSPKKSINEQYRSRNRQYEAKVKKMMEELQDIKQKIAASNSVQSLRINLRPNQQLKIVEPQQAKAQVLLQPESPKVDAIKEEQNRGQQIAMKKIIKNTSQITQQIEELKQVAAKLKQQTSLSNLPQKQSYHYTNKTIYIPVEKSPILQKIEDATSQLQISETAIPSFKYLPQQDKDGARTISNSYSVKNEDNLSSSHIRAEFPSNHQPNRYNVSTFKKVYNPSFPNIGGVNLPKQPYYSTLQPVPLPINTSLMHHPANNSQVTQGNGQRNSAYISSPTMMSSKSSTSILHPHLFHREASVQRSRANLRPSIVGSMNSSLVSSSGQIFPGLSKSRNGSVHRKGLNLTTSSKPS